MTKDPRFKPRKRNEREKNELVQTILARAEEIQSDMNAKEK